MRSWLARARFLVTTAVPLGIAMHREARAQLDDPRPTLLQTDDAILELASTAMSLAGSDLDDAEAVEALLVATGRRRIRAKRAAAWLRSRNDLDEDRTAHRANRLLLAVHDGAPPAPLTAEELAWFDAIDDLVRSGPSAVFARLAAHDPRLVELEVDVEAAAAERTEADEHRLLHMISEGLDVLWDDAVERVSPIESSATAWGLARLHLVALAGIALDDDERRRP